MKNYDIDRILKPAFKLFLMYNYESVSTARLEEETGLTRGAIFFKYKTKDALFKAVIDRYIFDFNPGSLESEYKNFGSLKDFIDAFLLCIEKRMNEMRLLGISNVHRGYFNLLYQAVKYYPSFSEKITDIFDEGLKIWVNIVSKAKDTGEIKPICDVHKTALQFRCIYSGMAFENSLNKGLDVKELREIFYSFYNNIINEK